MAGIEDITIIKFTEVDSAIKEFTATYDCINTEVTNLASNAERISAAVKSDASITYCNSLETLRKNVNLAAEKLNENIKDLNAKLTNFQEKNEQASNIASNLDQESIDIPMN